MTLKQTLNIIRVERWFKNLFVLIGAMLAARIHDIPFDQQFWPLIAGLACVCFLSSANYCINELFDAKYDKFHPQKKVRTAVIEKLDPRSVYDIYGGLLALGLMTALSFSPLFFIAALLFVVTGILYNIPPFRVKDIVHLDILSDAFTSPLRILLGWLIISAESFPPWTVLFGFWAAAAYFMGIKRFAELRCFDRSQDMEHYRRSFQFYTENALLVTSLIYGTLSIILFYQFFFNKLPHLILSILPFYLVLLIWYFIIGRKPDSLVQHPEHLYQEKGFFIFSLIFYCYLGYVFIF